MVVVVRGYGMVRGRRSAGRTDLQEAIIHDRKVGWPEASPIHGKLPGFLQARQIHLRDTQLLRSSLCSGKPQLSPVSHFGSYGFRNEVAYLNDPTPEERPNFLAAVCPNGSPRKSPHERPANSHRQFDQPKRRKRKPRSAHRKTMIIDVIVTSATAPTSHCTAWDFASVPRYASRGRKARRPRRWRAWVAEIVPSLCAKRRPAACAGTTVRMLRGNRHGTPSAREMNPHVAVARLPGHRQMMACYCNAALRRRRRWEPQPPPPTRLLHSDTKAGLPRVSAAQATASQRCCHSGPNGSVGTRTEKHLLEAWCNEPAADFPHLLRRHWSRFQMQQHRPVRNANRQPGDQ